MSIQTPVVFLVFNRPEKTKQVFARIRDVKPSKLFIVADGPRESHPQDVKRVQSVRSLLESVDWDCEVQRDYASYNLGLRDRISSGLDNVFRQVDRAIILEDDCLAELTFFRYCEELLTYYANDPQVLLISGYNPLETWRPDKQSYHFSRLPNIWGWATWSRAWRLYDSDGQSWFKPKNRERVRRYLRRRVLFEDMAYRFDKTFSGELNAWSYHWVYPFLLNNGLCVVPSVNQITNIGFDADATNTPNIKDVNANIPTQPMTFPLRHPSQKKTDDRYDRERHIRIRNMRRRRAWQFRLRYMLNL